MTGETMKLIMEEICVIGMGYIGLPTALMLAANGNPVVGVDINAGLVETLNNGHVTFQEDGLEELFCKASDIRFTTAYPSANVYIVAVPTPFDNDTKKIDPTHVVSAVSSIMDVCPKGTIVIIESTVAPGTIEKHICPAIRQRGFTVGSDIHLAHAPERIIPGRMIKELRENARVVGADLPETGEKVRELYSTFCNGSIVLTDIRTAEMTKVVENTYRDVNIAYANELAKICRQDELNVYEIIKLANMHPRVNILQPGPGVGGHCISVDPWFLVGDYPGLSLLIHEARKVNDSMPGFVLRRVLDILEKHGMAGSGRVGFYGLSYKEDVDDLRESPTLQLYGLMRLHLGGNAKFYDPICRQDAVSGQVQDFDDFIDACDLIVIMVGHEHIKENMGSLKGKIVLDTRNICMLDGVYRL